MKTLLHLTSSIFGDGGQSSRLATEFVAAQPGTRVIARDLVRNPVPHLDAERFGAFLSKPEGRTLAQQRVLAESDALIAELKAADTIVRDFLAFLGITQVKFVYAEGLAISDASKTQSLAAARNALRALVQPETIAA